MPIRIQPHRPRNERGAAIIIALFVTGVVAAIAVAMMFKLNINIRRTELIINSNQSYLNAQGSIAWAVDQLNNNFNLKKPNQLVDKIPIKSPEDKIPGGIISSTILDAQANFNINNLTDENNQKIFLRLLQILFPNVDENILKTIVAATIDWISPGNKNNALDDYYAKLSPPYRAAHRPMISISELRLVKGMTPKIYAILSPYLTALPEKTLINVNTAPLLVIMSLNPTMTLDSAKAIVAYRQQNPFPTTETFLNYDVVKNNPIPSDKITTTSGYFLLQTNILQGEQRMLLYTLLQRSNGQDSKANTRILWQSKGTL